MQRVWLIYNASKTPIITRVGKTLQINGVKPSVLFCNAV